MTPEQFRAGLAALNLSRSDFAAIAETHRNTVDRWATVGPVPGLAAAYIDLALKVQIFAESVRPRAKSAK